MSLHLDELEASVTHGRASHARDVHENGGAPTEIAARLSDDPWTPMGMLSIASIERWEILLGTAPRT